MDEPYLLWLKRLQDLQSYNEAARPMAIPPDPRNFNAHTIALRREDVSRARMQTTLCIQALAILMGVSEEELTPGYVAEFVAKHLHTLAKKKEKNDDEG